MTTAVTTADLAEANRVLAAADIADTDITVIIETDENGEAGVHTTTIAALAAVIGDAVLARLHGGTGITIETGADGRRTISATGG